MLVPVKNIKVNPTECFGFKIPHSGGKFIVVINSHSVHHHKTYFISKMYCRPYFLIFIIVNLVIGSVRSSPCYLLIFIPACGYILHNKTVWQPKEQVCKSKDCLWCPIKDTIFTWTFKNKRSVCQESAAVMLLVWICQGSSL